MPAGGLNPLAHLPAGAAVLEPPLTNKRERSNESNRKQVKRREVYDPGANDFWTAITAIVPSQTGVCGASILKARLTEIDAQAKEKEQIQN